MGRSTSLWHPNLDGLRIGQDGAIPKPLSDAVRTAYDLIYALRDSLEKPQRPVRSGGGSDWISVVEFGAIDDWDPTTETGTDNTIAIQTAIDSLTRGQRLIFPVRDTGMYLITAPLIMPRGAAGLLAVTLEGAHDIHTQIVYVGTSVQPCVINMIGSDGITWLDLTVIAWSDNLTFMPKTILMLGRYPDDDGYGNHHFERAGFMGNCTVAVVYSIASEANGWRGCTLFSNNGKNTAGTANHIFYTSGEDDFGICVPAVTTGQSNLDLWFSHTQFVNFSSAVDSNDNDAVYEKCWAGAGDHVYRDCYFAPSHRGSILGWAFRFVADDVNPFSGSNYVVEANRIENTHGFARLEKGIGLGIITGLRFRNNTLGVSAGELIYAEDGTTISQSTWEHNFPVSFSASTPTSIDTCERLILIEDYDQSLTVRTIASRSYFHLSCATATLSLPVGSFNNVVILHDRITMNGPIQRPTVAGTLQVLAEDLGGVELLVRDASGTTTGKGIALVDFSNNVYFSIYGGTDAGFPGSVQTRDVLPLNNLTWKLGNPGLIFTEIWVRDLRLTGSTAHEVLLGQGGNIATTVPAATAGWVLTSNGAAVDPTMQPVGVASGLNHMEVVATSSALAFTTSYVDIPGATLTLNATGIWRITACGGLNLDPLDTTSNIQLVANGSAQTGLISDSSTGAFIESRSASRTWTYTATSGDVVKIQGKKNSGAGGSGVPNNWAMFAEQLS